jgi:hypothetical protein
MEPAKEEKRRKKLAQFKSEVEAALAPEKKLSKMFEAILEMTHYAGKVDGLREGLELSEYGWRIQEDKPPAFRSMMKYFVKNLRNPEKHSAEKVCHYLDKEIKNIEMHITSEVSIRPPDAWACETWTVALEKKRNNVEVLISEAKKEAQGERYCTLMAWRTWGWREKQKKVRVDKPKEQLDRPELF